MTTPNNELRVKASGVDIAGLRKSYGSNEVLKGIDLTVKPGRSGLFDWPLRFGQVNVASLRQPARTA